MSRGAAVLLPALVLAAGAPATWAAGWLFDAETIVLRPAEGSFTVEADYEFRLVPEGGATGILFPFPLDEDLGVPELLEAALVLPDGRREHLELSVEVGRWLWTPPSDLGVGRFSVRLAYSQSTAKNRAVYLLTTARTWPRPLRRAVIKVVAPENCEIQGFTPRLRPLGSADDGMIFGAEFRDWIPREELTVLWTCRPAS